MALAASHIVYMSLYQARPDLLRHSQVESKLRQLQQISESQYLNQLQMEVIGRAQQSGENYCSRINYVSVIGTPLYNTVPRHDVTLAGCCSSVELEITTDDPIQQRGGIRRCSEYGMPAADDEWGAKMQDIVSNWNTINLLEGPIARESQLAHSSDQA